MIIVKTTCQICGERVEEKVEFGHVSSRDMGTKGKGSDTFKRSWICPVHGAVKVNQERTFVAPPESDPCE